MTAQQYYREMIAERGLIWVAQHLTDELVAAALVHANRPCEADLAGCPGDL